MYNEKFLRKKILQIAELLLKLSSPKIFPQYVSNSKYVTFACETMCVWYCQSVEFINDLSRALNDHHSILSFTRVWEYLFEII